MRDRKSFEVRLMEDRVLAAAVANLAKAHGYRGNLQACVLDVGLDAIAKLQGRVGLRPQQVATMLGCSKYTVYRDIRNGVYPNAWWKNSRVCYIPRSDVEAMIKNPVQEALRRGPGFL